MFPFISLAKSARGAALSQLILDALAAANVFVFGELIDAPSVAELKSNPQLAGYYSLLELFAYGSYTDYKTRHQSLPALTEVHLKKLKQLSIVTLAVESKIIQYDHMMHVLDIHSVRDLEDLIIDAIYRNVIKARLDQRNKLIVVEYTMGRDIRPDSVSQVADQLHKWSSKSRTVLASLNEQIANINRAITADQKEKQEFSERLERERKALARGDRGKGGGDDESSGMDWYGTEDRMEHDDDRRMKRPLRKSGRK